MLSKSRSRASFAVIPLQLYASGQHAAMPVFWNRHHDKKLLAFAHATGVPLLQHNKLVRNVGAAAVNQFAGCPWPTCLWQCSPRSSSWRLCRCLIAAHEWCKCCVLATDGDSLIRRPTLSIAVIGAGREDAHDAGCQSRTGRLRYDSQLVPVATQPELMRVMWLWWFSPFSIYHTTATDVALPGADHVEEDIGASEFRWAPTERRQQMLQVRLAQTTTAAPMSSALGRP